MSTTRRGATTRLLERAGSGAVYSKAEAALVETVRQTPALMEALRAARDVDAPDWLIAAGAIRDAVWDAVHERAPAAPRDVDLLFFDSTDLGAEREAAVEAALRAVAPALSWEACNQAAVHLWYARRFGVAVAPFESSAQAVATFPETATSVGLRLLSDDALLVVAPCGLADLLGCVCRRNPARASASFYGERVAAKGWRRRWPRMQYIA